MSERQVITFSFHSEIKSPSQFLSFHLIHVPCYCLATALHSRTVNALNGADEFERIHTRKSQGWELVDVMGGRGVIEY